MTNNVSDREIADAFALEDIFPSPAELLDSHTPISAADDNVLIALDTNALLLPYDIKAGNLAALREVYQKLSTLGRLFLPDRVIREFGRNRDKNLTDLIKTLEDRRSKDLPAADMPPILESIVGYKEAINSRDELVAARAKYVDAVTTLISEISKWRGDDPIIKMYSEIFKKSIVTMTLDAEQRRTLIREWQWRSACKVPPGYKDAGKGDSGIGDFLIWKCLLHLGKEHKKHLAFVTGEQKADWFARSSGRGIYPRIELLDEYRRASEGKSLRLLSLYELLAEMKVSDGIVQEVKTAEHAANTAILASASEAPEQISARVSVISMGKKVFNYSTNDGTIEVGSGPTTFVLRFSKASDRSIHFYKDGGNLTHIARVKSATTGQLLKLQDFDTTSRTYTLQLGDRFLARNANGYLLSGKIVDIKDDTRGAPNDEVTFIYDIATDVDGMANAV